LTFGKFSAYETKISRYKFSPTRNGLLGDFPSFRPRETVSWAIFPAFAQQKRSPGRIILQFSPTRNGLLGELSSSFRPLETVSWVIFPAFAQQKRSPRCGTLGDYGLSANARSVKLVNTLIAASRALMSMCISGSCRPHTISTPMPKLAVFS